MPWLSYITPLEIIKVNSPLSSEIKVVERFGKRTLLVNDVEQSGGTITGMWEKAVKRLKNLAFAPSSGRGEFRIKNCLVLGLGGGTVITLLTKYYPEVTIQAVELDPVIIEIAREYFGIKSSPKLEIINANAFSWIKNNKKKFDLVIFDIYLGKFNPAKARTTDFLKDLKGLLSRSGFILYNAHYQNDEVEYQKLLADCRKVFSRVELILSYQYSRILHFE